MDDNRFDSIAASVGAASSRRTALAVMLGGALSAAFVLAPQRAAAQGEGDFCRDDSDCGRGLVCRRSERNRRRRNDRDGRGGRNDHDGRRREKDRDGRRNREERSECRYINGCGRLEDFCEVTEDCCDDLLCNRNRQRCE